MLFNSHIFIFFFLPISLIIYFWLNKMRLTTAGKGWLVFTSLFFYSYWNIVYLPLILISVFVNYIITNSINEYDEHRKNFISRKKLFYFGLVFNIGLLGYFKYMDFFISNVNLVLNSQIPLLHLALPLAISFFTLQQIAFLVDTYEGLVKKTNLIDYMLFVTFFPQLIAGPIVHHSEMMPQFATLRSKIVNYQHIATGLFIFSIGLFKKVVIADSLSVVVIDGFDLSDKLSFIEAWFTSLAYTFQIYFDFSGYTDMAIGAALMMNIKLPINFNSPYKATGIIEFWSRWHITLTRFITTYLYTPILRSFRDINFSKAMFATFTSMLISGIWHGASWMFVFWGMLHGTGLVVNHYWKKTKIKMHKIVAWFITFNFLNITFIFFRATSWEDAMKVLNGMLGFNGIRLPIVLSEKLAFLKSYGFQFGSVFPSVDPNMEILSWFAISFIIVLFCKNSIQLKDQLVMNTKTMLLTIVLLVWSLLYLGRVSDFIYFNF